LNRSSCSVLALLLCLIAMPTSALAQEEPSPQPVEAQVQDIGLLFTQNATSGSLRALEGKNSERYVLTLNNPGRQVIWFQDRPGRQSGQMAIRNFIKAWESYGFTEDPPEAALSVLGGADHEDTAILTLGRPRYDADKRKLRFPARAESEATGTLANFESQRDRRVPRRFGAASLFIDDATGPVLNGCVIEPHIVCQQLGQEDAVGAVTIFNPTGTAYTITVNGWTQFPIPASTPAANWMPATGAPLPRTSTGQPADGEFGWDNSIVVSPTSGGGSPATAHVSIPHDLQTVDDLDLYLFYSDDPSSSSWILLWDGAVEGTGGMS